MKPEIHHSVCVCVSDGNNEFLSVQPRRVMDKYTFNNRPVIQYKDRQLFVWLNGEEITADQNPTEQYTRRRSY